MPITVSRASLLSRSVRRAVTGSNLTRRLNIDPTLQANNQDGSGGGGILQQIFRTVRSWASRFFGFLSSALRAVGISVSSIFGAVVNASMSLSNFDWNSSDREIAQMMRGNNVQIASSWGAAAGAGVGWIAGIGVGYGLTLLCPVIGSASLAKLVAGEASLEAAQEVGATAVNALRTTSRAVGTNLLLGGYRKFRKFFGINPADDAPSWTISGQIEAKIDSIQNPLFKAFIEEFTDEFFDSFIEAGYIMAYELDQQIAAAKAARSEGVERAVRIYPDKENRDEAIILAAPEDQLKTVVQTTLAQHRLIQNRDMGQIVGMPAQDWYKAGFQRRKLVILFHSRQRPPYGSSGARGNQTVTATIPEPKAGLDWTTIKRAAKPFNWGRFRCTANLTNGRQMAVYGATPQEAEEKLRDLLQLSTCEIATLSITEEKDRNNKLKKEPTRVYPAYGTALVRRPSVDTSGRTDLHGDTWNEEHIRFELWTATEPKTFKKVKW